MAGTAGNLDWVAVGWRRLWLPLSGGVVLLLALWARLPADPNIAFLSPVRDTEFAAAEALAGLEREFSDATATLEQAAIAALTAPSEPERAFEALRSARAPYAEWALILYEDGEPLAWRGRLRVPTETLTAPLSVVTTPFYTVLAVARSSGARRAVATSVIAAVPPADRIAASLAGRAAERNPVAGFTISAPRAGSGVTPPATGAAVLRAADGAPILFAEAIPLSRGEVRLSAVVRVRARIVIALGLATIVFLAIAWRLGRFTERFAAIGVALSAIAIVPFNTFSGQARLFDPAYFFTRVGGPWTANAGVFLLTSIVVALSAIALVRGKPRIRVVSVALAAAALLAVSGFLLIRDLADGIGQPARGLSPGLWLAWELPLFLSTLAVLLPIGWIISTGVLRRRRLPRKWFLTIALLAGMLAASLVWLTTVGQRMQLAEADIAALQRGEDDYLDALLGRLTATLREGPPPVDQVTLLRIYSQSELAVAGYSFVLASREAGGRVRARLDLTAGLDDTVLTTQLVERALASGDIEMQRVPGAAGQVWLAAVPHEIGRVTTIAVLPLSQLIEPSSLVPLLGLPGRAMEEPAYTMSLAEGAVPARAGAITWSRIGNELHANAPILTSAGLARVHAEIDLRSPEAIGQRLVLVLLINVSTAALLLLLVRAAERGFIRRARVRVRHWAASYRARITVALLAFFVIPAVGFAVWGYTRLAADNRHSRELVVRETLHAASAASADEWISEVTRRLGTPLFAYSNGILAVASDPLLLALAPLGRTLPPGVHLNLNVADELTATSQVPVGREPVLVGYRSTGRGEVLAAPARGTDILLARRAWDLTVLLLFATAIGAIAAFWLSGISAHEFGRPIAALRRAARAVARGERRPPELPRAPSEFEPVFAAFRRMAADLERSRVELARAERVLAWGEMARQVAHEIKNPLTPMRLGVQYLQRAQHDPRVDFDKVFAENTERILAEIDRLDEIARAFSRYGSAPTALPPPEAVDVAPVLGDLIEFERMGSGGVDWRLNGADEPCRAVARREELREVLMNVFENARAANARTVSVTLACGERAVAITVGDDGTGIPPDVLPRIFEPHFSTRTTGAGLGLAISRRLLDAWGGEMTIESEEGSGTMVRITLRAVSGGL